MSGRALRHARRSFLTAFAALLGGCTPIILSSNLDEYRDGTALALDPGSRDIPGDPDGDLTTNAIPSVFVTASGTDRMTGHELQIGGGRIDYRPADHDVPDTYVITWRGVRENRTSSAQTDIRIQDSAGRNAVIVRLEENRFTVREGGGVQVPQEPYSASLPHDVQITLDMGSNPIGVFVRAQEGGAILYDSPRLELLDPEFSSLHTIQIESQEPASYFLQALRVSAGN
jgi:hypothetical protein